MMIGIGIAILTISLFVFLLIDCLRRIEAEFPTLVYDGKTVSQRVIKRTWTWFLILSFALGLSTSQTIWGHSTTDSNFQSSGVVVTKYQYLSPFFIYKVETAEGGAKGKIHQVYRAATKQQALEAFDDFMALYEEKYPKACACLRKDKEVLFTFYDFPAAHWKHLRTTNPIESTFATVAAPDASDEGVWLSAGYADDGLQAGPRSGEALAASGRFTVDGEGASRCSIYRWRRAG